jgi:hypothetical protein
MTGSGQTSDAQLRIGESRDSGFDAELVIGLRFARTRWHRPGMTVSAPIPNMASRSRDAMRPRFAFISRPKRGRGECRMPAAPAVSCACCSGKRHTSNNEHTGITRHSRTQWFYDLLRALPGDRAVLPPSPADRLCLSPVGPTQLRKLDTSVGVSGPHDFAVRNNIARPCAADRSRETRPAIHDCAPDTAASTASRRTSVTIAIRPFVGRDGRINKPVST